ncbi:hypothetical protein C0J52_26377 [Blattella germanica]|nr:hypothetical protein C0J52_26377 [Blattella germanica]
MEDVGTTHLFINNGNKITSNSEVKRSHCSRITVPVRLQIGIMAFFMFFVTQMIRSNLYIARIGMMSEKNETLGNSSTTVAHTQGVTWPATHVISAHWIPSTERSKFMTSYHGSAVGTALTYPLGGLLMSFLDWESVFIMTGAFTLLWFISWLYVVYDKPSVHPRITINERRYLERAIGDTVSSHKKSLKTPWLAILRSGPFWAVLLASQGLMWGTITLSMQTPTYLKTVHLFDVKMNGFLSGIPEFCKFIFSIIFSTTIDHLLHKKYLTITAARKIAVATS